MLSTLIFHFLYLVFYKKKSNFEVIKKCSYDIFPKQMKISIIIYTNNSVTLCYAFLIFRINFGKIFVLFLTIRKLAILKCLNSNMLYLKLLWELFKKCNKNIKLWSWFYRILQKCIWSRASIQFISVVWIL